MTKITCDKCGKEIVVNPFMNVSAMNPNIIIKKKGSIWDDESIDLCNDCKKAFLKWLDEPSVVSQGKSAGEDAIFFKDLYDTALYKLCLTPHEVDDYRPACETFIKQLKEPIPNAIIIWLKTGEQIIFIDKAESEVEE